MPQINIHSQKHVHDLGTILTFYLHFLYPFVFSLTIEFMKLNGLVKQSEQKYSVNNVQIPIQTGIIPIPCLSFEFLDRKTFARALRLNKKQPSKLYVTYTYSNNTDITESSFHKTIYSHRVSICELPLATP